MRDHLKNENKRANAARKKIAQRGEENRYTPKHVRGRKFGRREFLIILLPVLAAVAAVAVVLLTLDRGTSYKLTSSACQYYGGSSAAIESGATLKRSSDGTTLLKQGELNTETNLPIYLTDSRTVVFPEDMLYFAPRSDDCLRLAYFSEVECKANGTVVVRHDGDTATANPGFLYDGKDFYLFLEPVILSFNGYTMELPALSYVEAVYGGYIMAFNYETKETFMELSDGTASTQIPSGDYTISLIGDSMTLYDGSKSLLATRADLFDPLI